MENDSDSFLLPSSHGYKAKDYDLWDQGFGFSEEKTVHKINWSRLFALE